MTDDNRENEAHQRQNRLQDGLGQSPRHDELLLQYIHLVCERLYCSLSSPIVKRNS
jgi:hypothetical protein